MKANQITNLVQRERAPKWLAVRYRQARNAGRFPKLPWWVGTGGTSVMVGLLNADSGFAELFDHWGQEGDKLVAEPYGTQDDPQLLAIIERFAETFGLSYQFERSTWFPPFTVKVVFEPRKGL